MSETDEHKYTSHCPICDSPLDLDESRGYRCPNCGWDESFELDDDEEWFVPDDRGD